MNSDIKEHDERATPLGLSSTESASLNDLLYWRSIDDEAKSGKKCLLSLLNEAGKRRTIVGFWVNKFSIEDDSDEYELGDFNEEDEMYYWHEGWYENIESHEFSCCHAIKTITHWMPLPKFAEAIEPPFPIGTRIKEGVITGIYEHAPAAYAIQVDGEPETTKRIIKFELAELDT